MGYVFENVAIIGIGLIGSSLARALRLHGLVRHIAIADSNPAHAAQARKLGLGDIIMDNAADAARGADLIVICTPVGAFESVARQIAPALKQGALVTDVGSVKQAAIDAILPHIPPGVHFIPGHPIAGTEHSGPDAGFPDLFRGRYYLYTPLPGADAAMCAKLAAMWEACGAKAEAMAPGHHDRVLAITSHLPHLIAYTIVGTATDLATDLRQEVIRYSASGFRDFTRLAASDPVMWRDIFLNNREAVLDVIRRFGEDLAEMQHAILAGEGEAMFDLFTRTRAIRRGIIEAKQDEPEEKKKVMHE